MFVDPEFTDRMSAWLATPAERRDVPAGALLLLRLTGNRVLYQTILRRPEAMAAKLEYELRKHLRIRLDGLTRHEVAVMEREIVPLADETLAGPAPDSADLPSDGSGCARPFRGKRADHDSLPPEVQAIYERGGQLWRKLKAVREQLMLMEQDSPCDRYELTKLLGELDREYRAGWERYDHYEAPATRPAKAPLSKRAAGKARRAK